MRKMAWLFAACAIAACAKQEESHQPHATTTNTTATAAAASSTAPYDLQFLDTMMQHHQMAIDMVKAAEGRFAHKELNDAGKQMVAEQQKEIAQMKAWRDQWYAGAAPAVNMNMPGMSSMNMDMTHMTSMSGNAHDLMFIDMMIPHHEGAVAMSNDALLKAEHPEIKELARSIIDSQSHEIDEFRQWRKTWPAAN